MKTKIFVTAIIGGLILLIAENFRVFTKLAEYVMQTPAAVQMILIPYATQLAVIMLTKTHLPETIRRMLPITVLGVYVICETALMIMLFMQIGNVADSVSGILTGIAGTIVIWQALFLPCAGGLLATCMLAEKQLDKSNGKCQNKKDE